MIEGSEEQQLPHQQDNPAGLRSLPISSWNAENCISTMEACMYEGTPYCTVSLHLHFNTATGYSKSATGYSKSATGYSKSRVNTSQLAFACFIDEDSSPTNSISTNAKVMYTSFHPVPDNLTSLMKCQATNSSNSEKRQVEGVK